MYGQDRFATGGLSATDNHLKNRIEKLEAEIKELKSSQNRFEKLEAEVAELKSSQKGLMIQENIYQTWTGYYGMNDLTVNFKVQKTKPTTFQDNERFMDVNSKNQFFAIECYSALEEALQRLPKGSSESPWIRLSDPLNFHCSGVIYLRDYFVNITIRRTPDRDTGILLGDMLIDLIRNQRGSIIWNHSLKDAL